VLAKLFTADATISGPGFVLRGPEEICSVPERFLKGTFVSTQHTVHNQTANVEGDRAAGETYCNAYHLRALPGDKFEVFETALRYQDEFVRGDGGWLFSSRILILEWMRTTPATRP
jgi:SnoaL-like domain